MRTANIVGHLGMAIVVVTEGQEVIDKREFASASEAEMFLYKAGWEAASTRHHWVESDVKYPYPVMVPPPAVPVWQGIVDEEAEKLGRVQLGKLSLQVCTFVCGPRDSQWAFCYRHAKARRRFLHDEPDIDPVLSFLCPAGVKSGGIGVWPSPVLAVEMGVRMLKDWEALYGSDFLAAAVDCNLHGARLRAFGTAGLHVESP